MSAPLQVFNCDQGTPEWHQCRAGIPTASEFATILTKGRGGEPSKTRLTYMRRLAGERITGQVLQTWGGNEHTERGHALEAEARDMASFIRGYTPQPVGFLRRGDAGCSPDSLVGDDGLVEVKTKLPHLHIELLESGEVPTEHTPQLQGQLWISGRSWVDFVSYWPDLPIFIKRVVRDEAYIATLAAAVSSFNDELNDMVERIRNYQEAA